MSKASELLLESPVAAKGDWEGGENKLINKDGEEQPLIYSSVVIDNYWKKVTKINNLLVFRLKKSKTIHYIIGNFIDKLDDYGNAIEGEVVFEASGYLDLAETLIKFASKKPLFRVKGVSVLEELRGTSIGRKLYSYLVHDEGLTLISDTVQYFGARRLWARLSQTDGFVVDVIDTTSKKVVDKGILLKHGKLEKEYDKKYYSRKNKSNIRFVLKSVD